MSACHNDVEAPIDVTNTGVFFLNSRIRYEDIPDGSANTIFLGEGPAKTVRTSGWASGTRSHAQEYGHAPQRRHLVSQGPAAVPGDSGKRGVEPPPTGPINGPLFVGGFGSYDPGGANFAFGDGSVRFLTETIHPKSTAAWTIAPTARLITQRAI